MNMGQKIKQLRKEKGMTLEELGMKVGVGKSTVLKWENGIIVNMRSDKISKIANALGCSSMYLMGLEDNLNKENSELIPEILADTELLDHIKQIMCLSQEHKQTIYDNTTYWYEKEGH